MSMTGCGSQIITPRWMSRPSVPGFGGRSRIGPSSRLLVLGAALGLGAVSFLATGLMHHMMMDIGRRRERLLAEGLSVLIASCLIAKLDDLNRRQRRLTMASDAGDCRNESSHPERSDLHFPFRLTSPKISKYSCDPGRESNVLTGLFDKYCPAKYRYAKRSGTVSAIFKHEGADTNESQKSSLR